MQRARFKWFAGMLSKLLTCSRQVDCLHRRAAYLFGSFLYDCQLAAIVAAGGAYGVVDVPCTTVRTYGERGSYGLVMGATLEGTGLGLSSFRMCHGSFIFFLLLYLNICVGEPERWKCGTKL